MSNKARNTSGKFAAKSETPRKIRSVNLTDDAWRWLAEVAAQVGVSRNDYLEAMAEGNIPFMETAKPQASPLMETVESDDVEIVQQPDGEVVPLMETVQTELESLKRELDEVKADQAKLLESSTVVTNKLRGEVQELRSQLATERADREEIEAELSDLKQNSASASQDLPDAVDLTEKAGEVLSFFKSLLPKNTKLPSGTISKIEKILEGGNN